MTMFCDEPKPASVWRDLALAAVGGMGAALISEVGQAMRDCLRDRREARRLPAREPKP